MYNRIRLLCGFSAVCASVTLSSLSHADEFLFVGPYAYYSFEDVNNSWSPKPAKPSGDASNYGWAIGNSFLFDLGKNPSTPAGIVVKNYDSESILMVKDMKFNLPGMAFIVTGKENGTTYYPNLVVTDSFVINGSTEGKSVIDINDFHQLDMGNVEIGTNLSSGCTNETSLRYILKSLPDTPYYYNSSKDCYIAADFDSVTLNGSEPLNMRTLNTAIWYLHRNTSTTAQNLVVRVGGLNGTGLVRNNSMDNVSDTTTLVFSNQNDAYFKGILADDWATAKKSSIYIIMDGSASATQTIVNVGADSLCVWGRDNLDAVATSIRNGTLAISGKDTIEFARVEIAGGALAVAESDGTGNGGHLWVRGIDWIDGKIKISINNTSLKSTNGISQLGDESSKYVFEVDLSNFASDFNFEGDEYTVLQSDGNLFGDVSKYEAEFTYNGSKIEGLLYEFYAYDYGLNVSIMGTIPEPSHIGFALGAFAIAAAIIRKRK